MAEVAGEYVIRRGVDALFDAAVDRYTEQNDLDGDEAAFLERVVELVVGVETVYRWHVRHRSDGYDLETFAEELRPLGREAFAEELRPLGLEATEVWVVADVRGYDDHEALGDAATAAELCALTIPDLLDAEDGQEVNRVYDSELREATSLVETAL